MAIRSSWLRRLAASKRVRELAMFGAVALCAGVIGVTIAHAISANARIEETSALVGPATVRVRRARTMPRASTKRLCAGGMLGKLEAELIPTRSWMVAGRERVDITLRVTSRYTKRAAAAAGFELVRDDGVAVTAPVRAAAVTIQQSADGAKQDWSVQTPSLSDGYYALTASVAGTDGTDEATNFTSLYLHVERGLITVIDSDEYFAMSNANMGRSGS